MTTHIHKNDTQLLDIHRYAIISLTALHVTWDVSITLMIPLNPATASRDSPVSVS